MKYLGLLTVIISVNAFAANPKWTCRAFNRQLILFCSSAYGETTCPPGTLTDSNIEVKSNMTSDYFAAKPVAIQTALRGCLAGARAGDNCAVQSCKEAKYGISTVESVSVRK